MKIFLLVLFGLAITSQSSKSQPLPKREFRGVWIATVANIDWPSKPGLTSQEQQSEFKAILDMHHSNGMNAVLVQVRPSADAFYESRYEPWSSYLTGKIGTAPNPYYDPLKFMIAEAHQRGLEFHAWFNPYRAVVDFEKKGIDSTSLAFKKPAWFVQYGNNLYFNPGLSEARKHVVNVVMEVVNQYDIDGVHFDDYFYPYKIKGLDFPDSLTFSEQGSSYTTIEDWRRNNVNLLIKEISDSIRLIKPQVQFGISPFGVWRNQDKDSSGSATKAGQTCYDDLYADVVKWQKEKWIDYVVPQIYWSIGFELADYKTLAEWWNKNAYNIPVYIGQATYRIGNNKDPRWGEPSQLPQQIRINRSLSQIKGSVFFSSKSFLPNPLGINDSLRIKLYRTKSLPPEVSNKIIREIGSYPLQFIGSKDGITLLWRESEQPIKLNSHHRYVVYRFDKNNISFSDADNIIAILPGFNNLSIQNFTDHTAKARRKYEYAVTSLDIYNHESMAEAVYPVINKKAYYRIFPRVLINQK